MIGGSEAYPMRAACPSDMAVGILIGLSDTDYIRS